ncbi:hypothetical protein [Mycobacterium montefiorense]|uniref:hypothetical protein n=1 Tax=Mycobacterium montefiorense TaxID=154654 RepID=UPI0021DEDF3B|nr:hypothetical protein [Mycobacterium montefiorense]MCV7429810.1 hypothetical protein [Mycobacterium montefiorense]GLE54106.1 hypothetical protein ATCCBAA256_36710 [Mycobacterium montefiorense]
MSSLIESENETTEDLVVGEVAAEDVATKDHVIDGDAACNGATSEGVQANTLTTLPLEQRPEPWWRCPR